jgi:hypothetical protein
MRARFHNRFISDAYGGLDNRRRLEMKRKFMLIGAVVVVVGALSAGIGIAATGGDEQPLAGSTLEQATDAALAHTGGGTVVETETGDDGAAYSVEIQLADGSQVEVNLDENFEVLGSEADDDGPGDDEGPDDDD